MLQPPTGYWVHYSSNYFKLNRLWCDTQEVWQDDLVVPPGLKPVNLNKQDRKKTEVKSLGKWQNTEKKSLNSQHCIPATKSLSLWTFQERVLFQRKSFMSFHQYLLWGYEQNCMCMIAATHCICVCYKGMSNNAWRIKMQKEHRISFALDDSFQHLTLPESFMTFLHPCSSPAVKHW